jgi:hypothetical protein
MIIAGIGIPTPMRPRGDGLPFIMVDWFVNGLSWWSTVSPTRKSPTFRFGVHSGLKSNSTDA